LGREKEQQTKVTEVEKLETLQQKARHSRRVSFNYLIGKGF